nr:hypothetical protein [Tanacetum cinerariifolium]
MPSFNLIVRAFASLGHDLEDILVDYFVLVAFSVSPRLHLLAGYLMGEQVYVEEVIPFSLVGYFPSVLPATKEGSSGFDSSMGVEPVTITLEELPHLYSHQHLFLNTRISSQTTQP